VRHHVVRAQHDLHGEHGHAAPLADELELDPAAVGLEHPADVRDAFLEALVLRDEPPAEARLDRAHPLLPLRHELGIRERVALATGQPHRDPGPQDGQDHEEEDQPGHQPRPRSARSRR
jgi:hypothetical protein